MRCKEKVFKDYRHYPCQRNAVIDGYCKQHHPDSVKERRQQQQERAEEKEKQSPYYRLKMARERIEKLEAVVSVARSCSTLHMLNTGAEPSNSCFQREMDALELKLTELDN